MSFIRDSVLSETSITVQAVSSCVSVGGGYVTSSA